MEAGLPSAQYSIVRSFMNSAFELLLKVWTGSRDLKVHSWLFVDIYTRFNSNSVSIDRSVFSRKVT